MMLMQVKSGQINLKEGLHILINVQPRTVLNNTKKQKLFMKQCSKILLY